MMKELCNSTAFAKTIWLIGLLLVVGVACQPAPIPIVMGTVKLPAGEWPYRIAMNPTSGVTYILNSNNSVSILQGIHLSNTIRLEQNAPGLYGPIVIQPHTGRIYIFDSLDHLIRVMEPDGTFMTMHDPDFRFSVEQQGAVTNPVNGYIYAINLWDRKENDQPIGGSVLVITDTEIIARVPVGRFPSAIAVNPINGLVYVGDYPEKPEDYNQMMITISGTQVIATSDMGQKPEREGAVSIIAIDSDTGQVFAYVNNQRLYALHDLKPIREKLLEKPVGQLVFNPVNRWLYVMMYDEVVVLDTELNIIKRIPLKPKLERSGNRSMAIDMARGYVYVGSIDDGTLTVIRDTKVITTVQVGWDTTDIGIDPQTGLVYAVNNMSGDVTIVGFPETTK